MTIRTARGVISRIRQDPGGLRIQVQQASDPKAAAAALAAAALEIAALDGGWRSAPGLAPKDTNGPKYVSEVLPAGTGPFIMIDGGYTPERLLRTIPDIVARHLSDAGVTDAVIAVPDGRGPLLDNGYPSFVLGRIGPAVILHLYPYPDPHPPGGRLVMPPVWVPEAADWVEGETVPGDDLVAMVISMQFPLPAGQAATLLEQARVPMADTILVAGELHARLRMASCQFPMAALFLASGGPGAGGDDLVSGFEALREVARRLVPSLGLAFISFESTFKGAWKGLDQRTGHLKEWCFDGFPYQILGPGHLERLGGVLPPGAQRLGDGMFELSVGDPALWLPDNPARSVERQSARDLLDPCLIEHAPQPW